MTNRCCRMFIRIELTCWTWLASCHYILWSSRSICFVFQTIKNYDMLIMIVFIMQMFQHKFHLLECNARWSFVIIFLVHHQWFFETIVNFLNWKIIIVFFCRDTFFRSCNSYFKYAIIFLKYEFESYYFILVSLTWLSVFSLSSTSFNHST